MGKRAAKNDASSNMTMDSNLATLKTPLAVVSSKLYEFNKIGDRAIFTDIKIFSKIPYHLIKFDQKHDDDVLEPV